METTVDPEAAIEWLERIEIPKYAKEDIDKFQQWLTETLEPTEKQLTALTDAWGNIYKELLPMGVTTRTATYNWGTETRYGISKQAWKIPEPWRPGFWSYEEMIRITGWKG